MKTCPRCKESKPLSEYGVNRSRRDNINPYCKACTREKNRISRELYREKEAARLVPRKECQPSVPIWRLFLEPRDAVLLAIRRGAKDQESIKATTRLDVDVLFDALADLWAEDKLNREALKRREYRAA